MCQGVFRGGGGESRGSCRKRGDVPGDEMDGVVSWGYKRLVICGCVQETRERSLVRVGPGCPGVGTLDWVRRGYLGLGFGRLAVPEDMGVSVGTGCLGTGAGCRRVPGLTSEGGQIILFLSFNLKIKKTKKKKHFLLILPVCPIFCSCSPPGTDKA